MPATRHIQWRAIARDGADLPPEQALMQEARQATVTGETFDFEYQPTEVRQSATGGLKWEAKDEGDTTNRGPVESQKPFPEGQSRTDDASLAGCFRRNTDPTLVQFPDNPTGRRGWRFSKPCGYPSFAWITSRAALLCNHASMGISAQGAEHLTIKTGRAYKHIMSSDSLVVVHCKRTDLFTATGHENIKDDRFIAWIDFAKLEGGTPC